MRHNLVIENILTNFPNLEQGMVVKSAHGNSPEIKIEELLDAIISHDNLKGSYTQLGIGQQTLNRILKRTFPNIKLQGGGQTWCNQLLLLSDYKLCGGCQNIKLKTQFCRDKYAPSGLHIRCRPCKNYKDSLYRANKLKATPPWVDTNKIKEKYLNCPDDHEVDHIVPLKGKNVRGLHVPWNLQYLTPSENRKKSNKY